METIIQCHQLSIKRKKKFILKSLGIHFNEGQVWGIIGQNAVGKTTFLETLAGLYHNYNGDIHIHNENLKKIKTLSLAKLRSIVLQSQTFLFPQTVFNILLQGRFPYIKKLQNYSENDIKITEKMIQQFNLSSLKNHLITELSGGEQQRVKLAQAFCQDTRIYFLDEPTNSLDLAHQISLFKWIKKIAKEKACLIIMVLHDVNLVNRFCDHCLMLFNDGTALYGKNNDILNKDNLEKIYHCPFDSIVDIDKTFWFPNVYT